MLTDKIVVVVSLIFVCVHFYCFPSRYVDIGDSIALQYGGSEAHKKVTAGKSESNIMPIGKVRDLVVDPSRFLQLGVTVLF